MAYTNLREIERRRALAQQLRGQDFNRGSTLSGLAHVVRQYGAGRAENLANEAERQNQELRSKETSALLQHLKGNMAIDPSTFSHPDIQGAMLAQELKNVSGGDKPSSVQEYEYRKSLPGGLGGEADRAFLEGKRQLQFLNTGGAFTGVGTAASGQIIPIGLKPADRPENAAAKAGAAERAKQNAQIEAMPTKNQLEAEGAGQRQAAVNEADIAAIAEKRDAERAADKADDKGQRTAGLKVKKAKKQNLVTKIDDAISKANYWTAGFLGNMSSSIAGTPAHDLSNDLNTIKANVGFNELQEMRDNSPTGGALGQVSEMENRLLQAAWQAVEQSQSPGQLRSNLEKLKQQTVESWERIYEAYEQDYGVPYGTPAPLMQSAPSDGAASQSQNTPQTRDVSEYSDDELFK